MIFFTTRIKTTHNLVLVILSLTLTVCRTSCEGILDQIINIRPDPRVAPDYNESKTITLADQVAPTLKRVMESMMSVGIPPFYEMNRNGNGNMGINVLSGLVKVERGSEAERNGLVGTRPLSVRIFGVPIFERGQRIRPPQSEASGLPNLPDFGLTGSDKPVERPNDKQPEPEDDEELPIES